MSRGRVETVYEARSFGPCGLVSILFHICAMFHCTSNLDAPCFTVRCGHAIASPRPSEKAAVGYAIHRKRVLPLLHKWPHGQ